MKSLLAFIPCLIILSGCCLVSGASVLSAGSLMSNTAIRLTSDGERDLIDKIRLELEVEKLRNEQLCNTKSSDLRTNEKAL